MAIKHKHHCQSDFDNLSERLCRRFYFNAFLGCLEVEALQALWRLVWMCAVLYRIWNTASIHLFCSFCWWITHYFCRPVFFSQFSSQWGSWDSAQQGLTLSCASANFLGGKCTHQLTWVDSDQYLGFFKLMEKTVSF